MWLHVSYGKNIQKHHSHCSRQGPMAAKLMYHFLFVKIPEKPLPFILLFNTFMSIMSLYFNVVFIRSTYLINMHIFIHF